MNHEIPYVSVNSVEAAKQCEKRLCELPAKFGILFVSVKAVPAMKGITTQFDITLGVVESLPESVGLSLVEEAIKAEIDTEKIGLNVTVIQGFPGAANSAK